MAKLPRQILVGRIDIAHLVTDASVPIDKDMRAHFAETRRALADLDQIKKRLEDAMKDAEAQNNMGNFEIQGLMDAFNRIETAAAFVREKRDDTTTSIFTKLHR